MYKAKNNLAPTEVAELLNLNNSRYSLRNKDFHLPTTFNTVTYGKHSFRYFGPLLWKRLNNKVKQSRLVFSLSGTLSEIQIFLVFFIIFYQLRQKKKHKQTNKQTERTLAGTPRQLWPITLGQDTNKKIKARNIRKHSDTRKTTTTYNKLLEETKEEHCYILNRQT